MNVSASLRVEIDRSALGNFTVSIVSVDGRTLFLCRGPRDVVAAALMQAPLMLAFSPALAEFDRPGSAGL